MGSFFDAQFDERYTADEARFQHAMESIYMSVTGDESFRTLNAVEQAQDAIAKVLAYYGATAGTRIKEQCDIEELLRHHLDSTGIAYRQVKLAPGWQNDAMGAMIAQRDDGSLVALIPSIHGGYTIDGRKSRDARVGDENLGHDFGSTAYCFYRPLPNEKIGIRELLKFMLGSLETRDYVYVILSMLVATLLGGMLPILNKFAFGPVVNSGDASLVLPVGIMLFSVAIAQVLINALRKMALGRIGIKIKVVSTAALMMRMLNLPPRFFREYASGNLFSRYNSIKKIIAVLEEFVFGALLLSVFSLIYLFQMAIYAPDMMVPALFVILCSTLANVILSRYTMVRTKAILEASAERTAFETSMINGIAKIRIAGAEKRFFSAWAERFARFADLNYGHPGIIALCAPITTLVNAIGLVVIYSAALRGGISDVASFMAFSSAYGLATSAFASLNSMMAGAFTLKPHMEMLSPILQTLPEEAGSKARVDELSGSIAFENVSFSYNRESKPILQGLNLSIQAGEYLGVVGRTGSGKSTIMRLIIGFETPQIGSVMFDGRDAATLDPTSLRRNIGVVMQNSTLLPGTIFENIRTTCPELSMDEAWEAAEMAGIADDIKAMPMGMLTMVSEGAGSISGGQRQRIMIARAIASKPKILLFDEATSALDNISQKMVSESLAKLNCTRVVIAHRLSTIQDCDRIIVIDGGKIAESGSFEELIGKNGIFTELAKRQMA